MENRKLRLPIVLSLGCSRLVRLQARGVTRHLCGVVLFAILLVTGRPLYGTSAGSITGTNSAPNWKKADLVFPRGTQIIKVHFDDPYTYSTNRHVKINIRSSDSAWGWETSVYPDSYVKMTGLANPSFYLSGGSGIGVLPFTGLAALEPGKVYSAIIECQEVGKSDYFGFKGLDGVMVIEEPKADMVRGSHHFLVKTALHQPMTFTFAIAP